MSKDALRHVKACAPSAYRDLPLADLAAFGIVSLERTGERLTIENICVVLHRLFPDRFSMVGFPEHPDGMRVNRTLLQMQPKYRNYLAGTAKKGYHLTATGQAAAQSVERYLATRTTTNGSVQEYHRDRAEDDSRRTTSDASVMQQVRESELFTLYTSGDMSNARGLDFLSLLDAFAHTPKKELNRRLTDIRSAARNLKDAEVLDFIDRCCSRFATLLK